MTALHHVYANEPWVPIPEARHQLLRLERAPGGGHVDLREITAETGRRHPWEVARARFFQRLLAEGGLVNSTRSILDVGRGTPGSRGAWQSHCRQVPPSAAGIGPTASSTAEDSWPPARRRSSQHAVPGAIHGHGAARRDRTCGRRSGVAPLVHESLAVDGWVVISVPANQGLFTAHDTAVGHFRRYLLIRC